MIAESRREGVLVSSCSVDLNAPSRGSIGESAVAVRVRLWLTCVTLMNETARLIVGPRRTSTETG